MLRITPWEFELETGIQLIDAQHKEFLMNANKFMIRVMADKGSSAAQEQLDFLSNYLLYHFQAEEAFMVESDFPKYLKHQAIHKQLAFKVKEISTNLKINDFSQEAVMGFCAFINEWILEHTLKEDREFAIHYMAWKKQKEADKNEKDTAVKQQPIEDSIAFEEAETAQMQKIEECDEYELSEEKKLVLQKILDKNKRLQEEIIEKAVSKAEEDYSIQNKIKDTDTVVDAAEIKQVPPEVTEIKQVPPEVTEIKQETLVVTEIKQVPPTVETIRDTKINIGQTVMIKKNKKDKKEKKEQIKPKSDKNLELEIKNLLESTLDVVGDR